jgi:hypothetical protein
MRLLMEHKTMSKSGGMLVANREAALSPPVNSQQLLEE